MRHGKDVETLAASKVTEVWLLARVTLPSAVFTVVCACDTSAAIVSNDIERICFIILLGDCLRVLVGEIILEKMQPGAGHPGYISVTLFTNRICELKL